MSRINAKSRWVGSAVMGVLASVALFGCGNGPTAADEVQVPRRSIVCAPIGITVTSADTVSVGDDGSCPIGYDTTVWT